MATNQAWAFDSDEEVEVYDDQKLSFHEASIRLSVDNDSHPEFVPTGSIWMEIDELDGDSTFENDSNRTSSFKKPTLTIDVEQANSNVPISDTPILEEEDCVYEEEGSSSEEEIHQMEDFEPSDGYQDSDY